MKIYLPRIFGNPKVNELKGLNQEETDVLIFMGADQNQQRSVVELHPLLCQVARARTVDMAAYGYVGHTDSQGNGPNYNVTQAGYVLPSYYGTEREANNIESAGGGYATAADLWRGWLNSPSHREHVLGLNDFYGKQTQVGVGYTGVTTHMKHYWVLITCPPES